MIRKEHLITASLTSIKATYQQLSSAPLAMRQGEYKAQFIGPWWLRVSAAPSLFLSGLGGWFGKKFINQNLVTNILLNRGQRSEKLQMECLEEASLIDGKQTIALYYGKTAPIPWRWVVDELRQLDEHTMLCMTIINLPFLKHFSFPFILSRDV
ncbi:MULTISPECIES: hypothetical protein [unclassified Acinetobacter]|uniref:hypothetical protein n=1 Tax=unclassified Acinetobacter TaxID=196816 RepID=UPI0008D80153|nr:MULTISPECIES: hypothetical protein [unclassified Acinetobacter]SEM07578.1 hypothetical protein SAMN05216500_110117 [Acinetobacter sp. DSM 11652]